MRISDWSSDVCSSDLIDALDIVARHARALDRRLHRGRAKVGRARVRQAALHTAHWRAGIGKKDDGRSEEHTSELQSLMRISYAVFCLKKKTHVKHKQREYTTHKITTF